MKMLEKKLIKETNIHSIGIQGTNDFLLQYYLTKPEENVYGIEIVKAQENAITESKHIFNLIPGKDNTLKMLNILFKNQVTPSTFADVVEDFLGII